MRTTDSNYRLDQAGEHFTRSGILLWRDSFYPKEAKWAHGHGRLSRANTHIMCSSNSYGYGDNGESLSLHRDIIFWRPQRDRFEVLPLMVLKEPTLWWLTPSTTWLWLEKFTQSFPSFFKVWCIDRFTVAGFLSVFQVTFPSTDGLLVNGICWQVSSKIARFPSAGPLFRSVVDSSTSLLVFSRFSSCFQWFALMYERWNWWLNHVPSDW